MCICWRSTKRTIKAARFKHGNIVLYYDGLAMEWPTRFERIFVHGEDLFKDNTTLLYTYIRTYMHICTKWDQTLESICVHLVCLRFVSSLSCWFGKLSKPWQNNQKDTIHVLSLWAPSVVSAFVCVRVFLPWWVYLSITYIKSIKPSKETK